MMKMKIKEIEIKEIIEFITPFLTSDNKKELTKETNISSEFGIDLLDVIGLIMELEEKFNINIKDNDLFQTIDSLRFKPTPEILTNLINIYLERKDEL